MYRMVNMYAIGYTTIGVVTIGVGAVTMNPVALGVGSGVFLMGVGLLLHVWCKKQPEEEESDQLMSSIY